jgi:hypothetical protein
MLLKPRTPYAITVWVRDDGTGPAAGVLEVSLWDGTGNSIIADDGSNNCTVAIDLTSVGSTYVASGAAFTGSGVVWTPSDLPATTEIAVHLTTALTDTRSVYIDEVVLQEATQPHGAGPQFALAAGGTDIVVEDKVTVKLANDWANTNWVYWMDRIFGLYELGRWLPTAGAGTINDALIA